MKNLIKCLAIILLFSACGKEELNLKELNTTATDINTSIENRNPDIDEIKTKVEAIKLDVVDFNATINAIDIELAKVIEEPNTTDIDLLMQTINAFQIELSTAKETIDGLVNDIDFLINTNYTPELDILWLDNATNKKAVEVIQRRLNIIIDEILDI